MTPAERKVWDAMERHAKALTPEVRAAIFALWRAGRGAVSDAEMVRLISAGDLEGLVRAVLGGVESAAATAPLRQALRAGVARSANAGVRVLPFPRPARLEVVFDELSPRIVEAITELESRALRTLTDDIAETVRQVLRRGLEAGVNPRALVPELKAALSLPPHQERAVANYRAALESGDFARARGYQLRDRRFDRLLKRGDALTPAEIDRLVARYRERAEAFNAATQARTAALDASRLGSRASWEAAIEAGVVTRDQVTKRWVTTLDGRERPTHHAMHGTVVGFDDVFPVDGGVQIPGQNAYNCRCTLVYKVR